MNRAIKEFADRLDSTVRELTSDVGTWKFMDYRGAARQVLEASCSGPEFTTWRAPVAAAICPGNGTSYGMILTPISEVAAMDEWSDGNVLSSSQAGAILVSMPEFHGRGAWAFGPGYTDVSYVAEKMGFPVQGPDVLVIAAFLNALWAEME